MALCLRGTGMYMTTDCTPMYSLPIQTVYGGTGAGLPDSMVLAGDSVGDGVHRGIIAAGIPGIILGRVRTGPVIGEAIGDRDGIILIMLLIMVDGADIGQALTIPIITDGEK